MTEYHIYNKAGNALIYNCVEAVSICEKYNLFNPSSLVYASECGYMHHFPCPINSPVFAQCGFILYKLEKHWYLEKSRIDNREHIILHTDLLAPNKTWIGSGDRWVHIIFGYNPIGGHDKENFGYVIQGGVMA